MRKILVTSGLPYANGPIHLGHLVEYIQTDIWVRFQKLIGNNCIYVCGDDAHGTPIMLSADKQGITPEELIAQIKVAHEADFAGFNIEFDNYYTTHSPENQALANEIYQKLQANGDIEIKVIEQAYDPIKNMFLPDRFIKGECPRCGAKDQYGDSCEVCGATYTPLELKNPVSVVSGATPIQKQSEHYFFKLEKYQTMLRDWINNKNNLSPEIANKLNEWLDGGLKQWDISRDAPYFGFPIPGTTDKFFYVWLDAPIGYMAAFKNLCSKKPELDFNEYWSNKATSELYHFVGKDIIYFHALFWPAILTSAGLRKPTSIFTHGFLTVNGQKMSKSRGTLFTARAYLENLNPEYLRFYFAAKLNNRIEDLDLNFDDFTQKVNSELVGKIVNIASRCAKFINQNFANQLGAELSEPKLFAKFINAGTELNKLYENREFSQVIREIIALADLVNQYIDEHKPWAIAKQEPNSAEVQKICTMGLNLFRLLIIYLKPILPTMAKAVEEFLNIPPLTWQDNKQPLLNHKINEFKPLMQRIDKNKIDELVNPPLSPLIRGKIEG
jgi:methionyl-tRNA synthetase